MKISCSCPKCVDACRQNPGWFGSIKEIEGAASIKGMSVVDFCREYLIREYWAGKGGNDQSVVVPAPRRDFVRGRVAGMTKEFLDREAERNGKGFVFASWGHNLIAGVPCVFLNGQGLCEIHASKPRECREVFGCQSNDDWERTKLLPYWKKHADWVKKIQSKIDGKGKV